MSIRLHLGAPVALGRCHSSALATRLISITNVSLPPINVSWLRAVVMSALFCFHANDVSRCLLSEVTIPRCDSD